MSSIKKTLVLVAAASLFMGCSGSEKPKSQASKTPVVKLAEKSAADILSAATSAMSAKGSVHIEITSTMGGKTGKIVNDTGSGGGRQIITLGDERTEIRLVDNVGYVLANEASLRSFFEFPAAMAKKYANKWLFFRSTDQGFDDITETLDMPTLVANLTLTGSLTKTDVTTAEGAEVVGVTGTDKQGGKTTLYIANSGEPLPVSFSSEQEGETDAGVFTRWGEDVTVAKPSRAVSISAVLA
jgi:hypothetical protein